MSDALLHELVAEVRTMREELRAIRADMRRVLAEREGKNAVLDWWRRDSRGCLWTADGLIDLAREEPEVAAVLRMVVDLDSEHAAIALGIRLARWPEVVSVNRVANTNVFGLAGDHPRSPHASDREVVPSRRLYEGAT